MSNNPTTSGEITAPVDDSAAVAAELDELELEFEAAELEATLEGRAATKKARRSGLHRTRSRAPEQASSMPRDIPPLTGLRIVGAAWVALYHFQPTLYAAWPSTVKFKPLFAAGGSGVPLFFLLSGFIIWHNYGRMSVMTPRGLASFLWRRFARLWPVNLAMQAAAIPILWIFVHRYHYWNQPIPGWYSVRGWLANAFMLGQWGHPTAVYQWDQPAWSLTAEMGAYVAFPFAVLLILSPLGRLVRNHWLWVAAAMWTAYQAGPPVMAAVTWPVRLTLLFMAGVLMRKAGVPPKWAIPYIAGLQIIAPAWIVVDCYSHTMNWVGVLLALWVYSLSHAESPVSAFFSSRLALIAGQASYSLYMVHFIVFTASGLFLIDHPRIKHEYFGLYAGLTLASAALASYLLWRFYESPARRALNRLFDRVWPRSAPAVDRAAQSQAQSQAQPVH